MIKPGMFISDRYEIIEKVGSGGMADVYKAKCHRLNRFVAIKILKQEYSDDKTFVSKFRGEAQSAAGLSHPNIVNVYDVGDDHGLHYIVMELVEGITLKNFIERKGKLEVKEAVGIAIQIAMGMEAAHLNHIIHRDIKPQNIIISREGKVKVTDFGIAKVTTSNTITSNAMGSVHYLSPEQARGGYSDEKSDIYSLGVTIYEMLTGQVPFAGDNTVSVALLHIQGEAKPLREIDPSIPLSVDKIVQKCMQKKPERRYLSASELIADLKKSISNPNGDFVVIPPSVVSDSPTITISEDEVNHIKSASKYNTAGYDTTRDFQNTDPRRNTENLPVDEEEDDLDAVDPRMEKIYTVGTIVMAAVLVILIIFFVAKFFNFFSGSGDNNPTEATTVSQSDETDESETQVTKVTLPSVEGLTLEDAQQTLKDISETLRVTYTEDFSDTLEKNKVMEQYPKAGTEVDSDADVQLIISIGPEAFAVPNVYNLTDEQAVTILEEAGLVVAHDFAFSDEIEEGRVIETIPARDSETMVVKGDTVTVVVSSGPESSDVSVPDLLGMTDQEASLKLSEVGLVLGTVDYDYSDAYEEGTIMHQGFSAGSKVKRGSSVKVTVSLGEGAQSYQGRVTVENPFEYSGESGSVVVELEQDGKLTTIDQGTMNYDDFPKAYDLSSNSGSNGVVRMFVGRQVEEYQEGAVSENGGWVVYEEYPTSWVVEFNPVN